MITQRSLSSLHVLAEFKVPEDPYAGVDKMTPKEIREEADLLRTALTELQHHISSERSKVRANKTEKTDEKYMKWLSGKRMRMLKLQRRYAVIRKAEKHVNTLHLK
jgi:hypothetical protein